MARAYGKRIKIAIAGAVTIGAMSLFAITLVRATIYAPEQSGPPMVASLSSAGAVPIVSVPEAERPRRLIIPSLGIDANVQQVGVTPAGKMGTPDNFTDTAWYKYGPAPGQLGDAVIDGHVDNGLSLPGVFKHLDSIAIGSDIYVVDQTGRRIHFVVTATSSYPYTDFPGSAVFTDAGTSRLTLITCVGSWVGKDRTYDHRLAVTAELRL
ncbi:MAG: class F sortase [Patescibacteria group bacterium]|nr:class F sortase [Patescibacteria group bacterium]MDE1941281.1 class F sortase [Patescibacteria group bacterium]MDE1966774.1 class F sortase [Patescibacteria group bacterium]